MKEDTVERRKALGEVMRAARVYFDAGGTSETLYAAITGVWVGQKDREQHKPSVATLRSPVTASDFTREGDRVITFDEWCTRNGFSHSTGQRLIASGKGPKFIQLSLRRKGVTLAENDRWRASRMRD